MLGATYDILDDAAIIAAELVQPQAGGASLGAQYDEIITSGDMAGGSTMVDVFPLTFNDPDGGSTSVTIDAFGTNPDGTLLDSNNEPDFPYDTTLGVRIKSTGAWVGDTNDDADGQYGGNMYESQVTFDAEAGVEYEVVVGAYSRRRAPELWGYLYDARTKRYGSGHRRECSPIESERIDRPEYSHQAH